MNLVLQFAVLGGIAAWMPGPGADRGSWPGARFLFAFIALPLGLYVGNVLFAIPLRILFWILVVLALAGGVRALMDGRKCLAAEGWASLKRLYHPVWVLASLLVVLAALGGGLSYQPYLGDEFTSWLRISRQIFLADAYWSDQIDYHYRAYTNGWPLLIVLPSLPFGDFSESRAAAMHFFMHLGLIGLTYDVLRRLVRDGGALGEGAADLFAWIGVLVVLAAEASWLLLPTDLLIERPALYALLALFLLGLLGQFDGFDRLRLAAFIGFAWAAGYLLKVSALAAAPAVGLFWLTFLWRDARAGGGAPWLRAVWLAVAMAAPLAVVYFTWGQIRPGESCQANISALFAGDISVMFGAPARALTGRMGDAALAYMAVFKPSLTLFSLATLAGALFSRRLFILPLGFAAFFLFYLAAMFTAYVFCYGALEGTYLESFARFIRTPVRVLHFVGLLALFAGLAELALGAKGRLRPWAEGLAARRWAVPCAMGIVCAGLAWQTFKLDRSLTDMATRRHQDAKNVGLVLRLRGEARALRRILAARGMESARISMIEQGGYDVAANVANYYGIKKRRGGTYFHYIIAGPYNWATAPGKFSTRVVTEAKLAEHWRKFDVVWPVQTDPWIREVLASITDDPRCRKDPEAFFLLRTGRGGFECVAKQRKESGPK